MECNAGLALHTWHDIMPLPHCTGSARSCLRKVCEGLASGGGGMRSCQPPSQGWAAGGGVHGNALL